MVQDRIRILYVVVLYGQIYEMTNVYKSLLIHVDPRNIWIWDNSPNRGVNIHLNFGKSYYFFSEVNVGLSLPYNCAGEYAFQNNYQWMVLLDQDTEFDALFINTLNISIKENCGIKLFCPQHCLSNGLYLSPTKLFLKFTRLSRVQVSGIVNIKKFAIINSGLTVDVATFRRAGGYNEKVFLDYSDFQFLDRLAKVDSKAFCLNSVCLQDFSNDCMENDKVLKRFTLFCQSLKGCEHNGAWDAIEYHLVVLKRCLSLIYRLKSFQPFITYYKYYIK